MEGGSEGVCLRQGLWLQWVACGGRERGGWPETKAQAAGSHHGQKQDLIYIYIYFATRVLTISFISRSI